MSDYLVSLSFSLSLECAHHDISGELPGHLRLGEYIITCVIVQVLAIVAGEYKTESSETRKSTLPLLSIYLSLFSQVVFPVLSRSSRVYAGRASRYVGEVGETTRRASPAVSIGVGHP